MAVDAGRYLGGQRRQATSAPNERRQKQILAGGSALLALLLAFQAPRLLHRQHPPAAPSAPPTAAQGAPTPVGAAPSTPAATASPEQLARLRALAPKDPFAGEPSAAGSSRAEAKPASPPHVRLTHFVAKDPFAEHAAGAPAVPPLEAAAAPSVRSSGFVAKDPFAVQSSETVLAPATPTSTPGTGSRRYVVVLASIPLPAGRAAAAGVARFARARGLAGAGVLRSSGYRTLRRGLYVVHGGIYPSANRASRALALARTHGFPTAYSRPLGR
jgi:hypothetical protein